MSSAADKILEQFSARRIILPVLIGLGALSYFFIKDFDMDEFALIRWSAWSFFWLALAVVMMALRHFFYMWRIRYLTDNKLGWTPSFQVIALWEFSSAATPTAVGGTAVALFLLAKENITAGKSIALVLCTIFLDMIFLMAALLAGIALFGFDKIFPFCEANAFDIRPLFTVTFILMAGYTFLVAYGLFGNTKGMKWLLVKITSFKWLRRWQPKSEEIGDQLIIASKELTQHRFSFWVKTFVMTACTWTARFLVASCLVMMLTSIDEHVLFFFRQFALMVMLMMSPTPGGSGVAELSFDKFICDLVPGNTLINTFTALWRLFTYYPYLFLGLMVLPRWVRRVFAK